MAEALVEVVVETALGRIVVGVDQVRAPLSASGFLAQVDMGALDGSSVYRIVTEANQPPDILHRIEVIQWGHRFDDPRSVPAVPHEPTSHTGLQHRRGALSMARREIGTAGFGFVFCMGGDLESLNEGGGRQPDGHGFAAFGEVLEGWPVLEAIFARAEPSDRLQNPIAIHSVRRA